MIGRPRTFSMNSLVWVRFFQGFAFPTNQTRRTDIPLSSSTTPSKLNCIVTVHHPESSRSFAPCVPSADRDDNDRDPTDNGKPHPCIFCNRPSGNCGNDKQQSCDGSLVRGSSGVEPVEDGVAKFRAVPFSSGDSTIRRPGPTRSSNLPRRQCRALPPRGVTGREFRS